jgi:hypothetical protein
VRVVTASARPGPDDDAPARALLVEAIGKAEQAARNLALALRHAFESGDGRARCVRLLAEARAYVESLRRSLVKLGGAR